MPDSTARLIGETVTSFDEFGNPNKARTTTEVFCDIRSVTRSEFYSAAHNGLQPSLVLRISHAADYNGEKLAEVDGRLYSVIRSYRAPGTDAVELTLQAEIGTAAEAGDQEESDGGI